MPDGSFAAWRGSPVTVAGTWNDGDAASQQDLPTLRGEYASWDGDIDVAVGGTVLGSDESYAAAAQGAYLDRWTTMAKNLQALRGDKQGTTYVRPFHEFNGNWYKNWQVTPENVGDYQAAFRLMAQTVRTHCPRCKIVWSPANGTSSGSISPVQAYPGDDVVDVVGVDHYNANGNPIVTDEQSLQEYLNRTDGETPVGVEAWRRFAESHGKPFASPEWGLNSGSGGGDNPAYIQGMNAWMAQHAARPGDTDLAGKVLYDVYFNIAMGDNDGFVIKGGPNPQSGQVYTGLKWGTAAGAQPANAQPANAQPADTQPANVQPAGDRAAGQPVALSQSRAQNLRVGPVGRAAGEQEQAVKDVGYASTSPAQRLDLYLPRGTGAATPLVVAIHGGAFREGDKADADVTTLARSLVDRGYAVAAVNYRLSGEARFPAGVQDVKAAVRWLRAHASEYGIDPNRFVAWGTSAGGYLATMLGVTGAHADAVLDDASLGNPHVPSTVQAVVSLYGPSDFASIHEQLATSGCEPSAQSPDDPSSPEVQWLGGPVRQSPLAEASNPINWARATPAGSLPPFFLGHGGSDCTVPVGQSAELSDALKRAGTTVQLQVVEGAGHSDPRLDEGLVQPAVDFVAQRLTGTVASTGAAAGTSPGNAAGAPAGTATAGTPSTPAPSPDGDQARAWSSEPGGTAAPAGADRQARAATPPAVASSGS